MLAAKIHFGLCQRLHHDGVGLDIHRLRVVGVDRNWAYSPSCKMALP